MTTPDPTLVELLGQHNIECTGRGEVTCRGCPDKGWMSWPAYRAHLAQAITDAGYRKVEGGTETRVEWAVSFADGEFLDEGGEAGARAYAAYITRHISEGVIEAGDYEGMKVVSRTVTTTTHRTPWREA